MPTYVYRREDGSSFEIQQRITEDPLETCPTTGQPVKRVITGNTGIIFKGSGFYITDYERSGSNGASPASTGENESGDSGASGTDSKKSNTATESGSAPTTKDSSASSSSSSASDA
ncbi:MAG: zinc ribbon domain-containing protein [Bacteroidetes bacterium]|jgi:putative FmdB family regulatory protein|nr:zinc ribbon domain-containing protein [Bacteroidota bacterium]